jgi:DNA-binding MarR family transcriptional regulator
MIEPTLHTRRTILDSSEAQTDPIDHQKHIQTLLTEVNAVSTQWRLTIGSPDAGNQLLAGEVTVLQTIERLGPQTVPQIAKARLTSRQNIQVLVNRLVAGGYLETTNNPKHKRSVMISLTPHGRQLLAQSANRQAEILKDLSTQLSARKVTEAVETLNQLRSLLADGIGGRPERLNHPGTKSTVQDLESTSPEFAGVQVAVEELPVNLL